MGHPSRADLEAAVADIDASPADHGRVELIVCRPAVDERTELAEAVLDEEAGLVGDDWARRASARKAGAGPDGERQVTVMNARVARAVAGGTGGWSQAGDQLYVDLDLGVANLAAGTRLVVGTAVLEVTAEPHLGCAKFARRFGREALAFVNSAPGRRGRRRGLNARVVRGGRVRVGDPVRKQPGGEQAWAGPSTPEPGEGVVDGSHAAGARH